MDCNPNATPAPQTALGAEKKGEPFAESWSYQTICGMCLYLSTNTRPDIALAVSQICRFGHNPKKSHGSAVKTLLRYLKKTMTKGMIIQPTKSSFNHRRRLLWTLWPRRPERPCKCNVENGIHHPARWLAYCLEISTPKEHNLPVNYQKRICRALVVS